MAENAFFTGVLPLPPSINRSYKSFFNAKTGKSAFAGTATARSFKKAASNALKNAQVDWHAVMLIQAAKRKKKQIPLEMTLHFYFEHMWMRDIDSGLKAATDAAFKYLQLNDNLIIDLHIKKRMDKSNPRVEVNICIAQE
jgi:Holliday junction resolvase RusA-like endonuclease